MTSEPTLDAPDPRAEAAAVAAFGAMMDRILRRTVVFGLVAAVALCVAAVLVSGLPGLWGALTGAVVGGLFLVVTLIVGRATRTAAPTTTMAAMLGSFLVKMVLIAVVLLPMRELDSVDTTWLMASVLVVAIGMMAIEVTGLLSARTQPLTVSMPEVDDDGNPIEQS